MSEPVAFGFTGLVDLAAAALGGRALGASDDFFAAADNLVQPGRGVFIEGKYTERGKWMDGWESRRRRARDLAALDGHPAAEAPSRDAPPATDHDWCILELGAPGEIVGFDVDTNHFVGNHPPFASIEGLSAPKGTSLEPLAGRGDWTELLAQAPLRPGSQNLFAASANARSGAVSHVRLNIFPDGGVARLRVFGRVAPGWSPANVDVDPVARAHLAPELVDLVALANGGLALACSDAFFGPMNNLLLPGRSLDMSGGWETRRRRGTGYDWILLELGGAGTIETIEIDTNHFLGNYPDRCSLEAIHAPGARITDLLASAGRWNGAATRAGEASASAWSVILPESQLRAHARQFFNVSRTSTSTSTPPATHVLFNIFPDGGVSRLRLWGRRHG